MSGLGNVLLPVQADRRESAVLYDRPHPGALRSRGRWRVSVLLDCWRGEGDAGAVKTIYCPELGAWGLLRLIPLTSCRRGTLQDRRALSTRSHMADMGLSAPRLPASCHCVFHSSLWSCQKRKLETKPRHGAEEQERGSRRWGEAAKGQRSLLALDESCKPKRKKADGSQRAEHLSLEPDAK
ncbi:hypothetical protein AOLI_G00122550 [Acnodon oligacanthus]